MARCATTVFVACRRCQGLGKYLMLLHCTVKLSATKWLKLPQKKGFSLRTSIIHGRKIGHWPPATSKTENSKGFESTNRKYVRRGDKKRPLFLWSLQGKAQYIHRGMILLTFRVLGQGRFLQSCGFPCVLEKETCDSIARRAS